MTKEEDLEKQLINNTKDTLVILAETLVSNGRIDYKDYAIPDDKPLPYYNALIDFLKIEVKKSQANKPTLKKFDKMIQEREAMSEEDLEKFKKQEARMLSQVDSILATLESRCTLKGNLYETNTIMLRNRKLDPAKYPFGVVM